MSSNSGTPAGGTKGLQRLSQSRDNILLL
jgi:hypothetical protein